MRLPYGRFDQRKPTSAASRKPRREGQPTHRGQAKPVEGEGTRQAGDDPRTKRTPDVHHLAPATLRPSGPGPALRQLSTGTPAPLRSSPLPAALRLTTPRRRPPHCFRGGGGKGVAPHVSLRDYADQHKNGF